ncbi:MAG TPA: hypothetical protein DCF78_09150 [Dehalococcoidia bacterium]|nr:hypothetical protein [Dehalococcoidia bacterium]
MTGSDTAWSGDDSRIYSRLADIAVPSRREQMAILITQIRFKTTDAFKLVDLACGESGLTKAIQTLYPKARATALDGSQSMLTVAPINLAEFEDRTETGVFDITAEDWLHQIDGVGLCVVPRHPSSRLNRKTPTISKRIQLHRRTRRAVGRRHCGWTSTLGLEPPRQFVRPYCV